MAEDFKFNRMELSGSLGDLGTILPLAFGMILINNINPANVFFCIALYYIFSGFYFRVTSPVEPMKIIAAYAISSGISPSQIQSSCLLVAIILLLVGATGLIKLIRRYTPVAVIRGIQLSTGLLLVSKGVQLMLGTTPLQKLGNSAEPHLAVQSFGSVPIGLIIGGGLAFLTLFLLNNRKVPAALSVVTIGLLAGFLLRTGSNPIDMGLSLPAWLPYGLPTMADFSFALIVLVLPQIPMTIGNAVIATADLNDQYFPQSGKRITHRSLCLSMAIANFCSFFLGGIPMCQGAGGLASRYRFGARTAGSNLIIGFIFLALVIVLGQSILQIIHLMPMAALGVLLIFAGIALSLTLLDIHQRNDMFVVVVVVGITLASNLAAGFLLGLLVAHLLNGFKVEI